jgi:hypothetical protein
MKALNHVPQALAGLVGGTIGAGMVGCLIAWLGGWLS